jgi:hypothetical protein
MGVDSLESLKEILGTWEVWQDATTCLDFGGEGIRNESV